MSKNNEWKENIIVRDNPKNIKPTHNFTYLGIQIETTLKWNLNIQDSKLSIIAQPNTRLNALKLARQHMSNTALLKIANGIFLCKTAIWN